MSPELSEVYAYNHYVSNAANIYMTSFVKEKNREHYSFGLIKINSEGIPETYAFVSEKRECTNATITEDDNGNIIVGGNYFIRIPKKNEKKEDGVYYYIFDEGLELVSSSFKAIPKEICFSYTNKNERSYTYMESYKTLQVIKDNDYIITISESQGRSDKSSYQGFYGSILVSKFNEDELLWSKKIPKRQKSMRFEKSCNSYKLIEFPESIKFLFLDHRKNINLRKDASPIYHTNGGLLSVADVTKEDGEIQKSIIYDSKKLSSPKFKKPIVALQFSTDRIVTTENGFVVEAYKKGKQDIMIHVDWK